MTAVAPLKWDRRVIDASSGESIGRCSSDLFAAFMWPLAIVMLIPTILAGAMAWKTNVRHLIFGHFTYLFVFTIRSSHFLVSLTLKRMLTLRTAIHFGLESVSSRLPVINLAISSVTYGDSRFTVILVQIEIAVVGIPVSIILRDHSTNGRYFGIVAIVWTFPVSTIMLIIFPKFVSYWHVIRGHQETAKRGSGGRGEVHVTGLENKNTTNNNNSSSRESHSHNQQDAKQSISESTAN